MNAFHPNLKSRVTIGHLLSRIKDRHTKREIAGAMKEIFIKQQDFLKAAQWRDAEHKLWTEDYL